MQTVKTKSSKTIAERVWGVKQWWSHRCSAVDYDHYCGRKSDRSLILIPDNNNNTVKVQILVNIHTKDEIASMVAMTSWETSDVQFSMMNLGCRHWQPSITDRQCEYTSTFFCVCSSLLFSPCHVSFSSPFTLLSISRTFPPWRSLTLLLDLLLDYSC